MNRIIFLLLVLVSVSPVMAQDRNDSLLAEKQNIKVVSRYRQGAVELRWYPVNAGSWRKANQTGYTIKRLDLSDPSADYKMIAVVKPYTAEQWSQKTNVSDELVRSVIEANQPPKQVAGQHFADRDNEESAMFFAYIISTSLSAEAARGAGLMYSDNTIHPGGRYAYRISIAGKKEEPADVVLEFVEDTRNNFVSPAPMDLTAEEGEGTVKLTWNNTTNQDNFVAYEIERSGDGGKTFQKLNQFPFLSVGKDAETMSYTDSVKNYVRYHYRVVGITPWVDKSTPSQTLLAMGRDKTPASPPLNTRAKGDRNKILVTWELPVMSKDLQGFKVARSHKLEGPFSSINGDKLVSSSQKLFIDEKPSPLEPYYAVYSVDTAGNYSSTFSVMASVYDTTGPSRPVSVRGIIDSTGVVKLNWDFGKDNDLIGYQVYRSTGRDNVFHQLTGSPLVDSVFVDTVTMRSLDRDVFYKLTAVDYNNNASAYSELITVKRPDVVAPAAPLISQYTIGKEKVSLSLVPSSSNDIRMHRLTRTDENGRTTTLSEQKSFNQFTDSAVNAGATYTYHLVAIDESGLSTTSKPLPVVIPEQEIREGISTLTGRLDEKNKKVYLQWKTTGPADGTTLVLLRGTTGGDMEWYKKMNGGTESFTETLDNGNYQYAIKVLYNNGAESEPSRPVMIEVK